MLLRETIRKTKFLFHRTLRNFKCFIFGGYQKLPRSLSFNTFLGRTGNATKAYTSDQFYNEFYDILQCDLNRINRNGDISMSRSMGDDAASSIGSHVSSTSFAKQSPQKNNPEDGVVIKEKRNKGNPQLGMMKEELKLNSKNKNEGVHDLAQKMKEFEMLDSGDVEHVLDIEEALHYYSRLTSPVYLDIVDQFFTDMHSEFSIPQSSSVSFKHSKSKGRLGSIRL